MTKTVFILLHGSSISSVEPHLKDLKQLDVSWASLNRFDILEQYFNLKFHLVWLSSPDRIQQIKYQPIKTISHTDSLYAYGFCSLFAMICCLVKMGYTTIILFGADGGAKEGDVYFKQEDMNEDIEARRNSIYTDTVMMNNLFWILMPYWGLANRQTVKIYNTNPNSLLTCFEKIDIKDVFNYCT